jgi:hypothetical protein
MRLRGGSEERGCGYRVKKDRIYVQLQLHGTSCSRRVLRRRPYILRIKTWQRILRDCRHGFTVCGEQPDRSFDMQLQVNAWRCRPAIIRGRVRAQRNSAPKTPSNLMWPGIFCPHRHEVRKSLALNILFLVDIQQRCLRTHSWWNTWTLVCTLQKHENPPSIIALSGSSRCTWNCIFTLCPTYRTCSWSEHESWCTNLRNHVMSTDSDPTPGCPDHFTTPHPHFHLFLSPLRTNRKEPVF